MPNEEIPYVEAEIVDAPISPDLPPVPIVTPDEVPEGAVPAPRPSMLRRSKRGRKMLFSSAEELEAACNKYFSSLLVGSVNPKFGEVEYVWKAPPTVPGLSRALGMSSEALRQYGMREEFGEVVEWAKDVIREYLETGVTQAGNQSGKIFLMKNLGYSDTKTYTFAPPSRLEAAQTPEEIAKLISEDIV